MSDVPHTVRELRTAACVDATRAEHVFARTLTTTTGPLTPSQAEKNLLAAWAARYGFTVAEVFRQLEERLAAGGTLDREFLDGLVSLAQSIAEDGDDGRSHDVWPAVEAVLAQGGVGTPQWEAPRLTSTGDDLGGQWEVRYISRRDEGEPDRDDGLHMFPDEASARAYYTSDEVLTRMGAYVRSELRYHPPVRVVHSRSYASPLPTGTAGQ